MDGKKEDRGLGSRKLTAVLLVIYLAALVWIVLLKMQTDLSALAQMGYRSVNLIPFSASAIVNGRVEWSEIVLNVLAFAPFGGFLSMLWPEKRVGYRLLPVFGTSLAIEVFQYVFAIGGSDITDLLGNTLGGLLGIGLFALVRRVAGRRAIGVLNGLALCAAAAFLALLALLVAANR